MQILPKHAQSVRKLWHVTSLSEQKKRPSRKFFSHKIGLLSVLLCCHNCELTQIYVLDMTGCHHENEIILNNKHFVSYSQMT